MATERETKEMLVIAFSAYASHKEYSSTDWLRVQDAKRNDKEFRKRYDSLRARA
jgi:hypothetical protein